jgi:pyruvate/2-oxoglutarate dehydrogenase complex dihydrolipoamide acyltransferase (E2) component
MSVDVLLPKLGFSMTEGMLTAWLAADGDAVREGQPLFELESEKSVQQIEAPASGVLKTLKGTDQTYAVGVVLATIG